MWPFSRCPTSEKLRGLKTLKVSGMKFTIRKINPFVDFPDDKIPSMFTDKHETSSEGELKKEEPSVKKILKDMEVVLLAGVVEPELRPNGTRGFINVEDLFRDPTLGVKLYYEIISHSLSVLKWRQRVFFWTVAKWSSWTLYASDTVKDLATFSSRERSQV